MNTKRQQAQQALQRANAKAEDARKRGAWGALEQIDARIEAAAHRLHKVETLGTDLPSIVTVYEVVDHGPCDGGPSARCPHCGAGGRYIHHAITSSGAHVAAMSGCIQLFPQDSRYKRHSKLVTEAYNRRRKATEERKNLASWWSSMIEASEGLRDGRIDVEQWAQAVWEAENNRQSWLNRNGYGRRTRR